MIDPIRIDGLAEFSRNLRKLENDLPKGIRLAGNEAAELVVTGARAAMPRRTGRAARTVKAKSTRTAARVSSGSARVPYVPWLDYGGEGRRKGRPAYRTFKKDGRYVYPAFYRQRDAVQQVLEQGLLRVAKSAGVEVD
ncbi:HK97 gp10 family phage protein [Micromonospora noduli]|uniref:HK97 gp10 family phage protein n=1 Tax=Micromonospora noduli TaxID=709876 RepID=UPI00124B2A33|nr:HK97 gp10 family phage protein [Micromonospora noduli]KAB1925150.1 HK97 gp10 family phage protein [Micromonospora noduli]